MDKGPLRKTPAAPKSQTSYNSEINIKNGSPPKSKTAAKFSLI